MRVFGGKISNYQTEMRRHGRSQEKRAGDTDTCENTAVNSFLESLDINNDVRQFRH